MNENIGHFRRQAKRDHAENLRHHTGGDVAEDKALIKKAFAEHDAQLHGGKKTRLKLKTGGVVVGEEKRERLDRASGGRTKHKGKSGHKTIVNVVIPQKDGAPGAPMAGAPPMPPMAPPAPHPPMMPPPGAGGPPPGGPPGMGPPVGAGVPMPHKRGGRIGKWGGGAMPGAPGMVGQPVMPGGAGMQPPPIANPGMPIQRPMPGGPDGLAGVQVHPGMGAPMPSGMGGAPAYGQPPVMPGGFGGGAGGMNGMPVGRKAGGKVPNLDAGAGGGEGRMEKMKAYGSSSKSTQNASASDGDGENKKMRRGGRA